MNKIRVIAFTERELALLINAVQGLQVTYDQPDMHRASPLLEELRDLEDLLKNYQSLKVEA